MSVSLRISSPIRRLVTSRVLLCHHEGCLIRSRRSMMSRMETFLRGGVDLPNVIEVQNMLVSFHHTYGSGNWGLDIIASTIMLKIVFSLPLMSWRTNIFLSYARMMRRIQEESNLDLGVRVRRREVDLGDPEERIREMRRMRRMMNERKQEEVLRTNGSPIRGFIVTGIEGGIYVTFFLAVKNLCLGVPDMTAMVAQKELSNSPFLWLCDLTSADPYHIFPLLAFMNCIATTEYMVQARKQNGVPNTTFLKLLTYGGRLFSFFFCYVVLNAPSAIAVYWTASTSIGLLQVTLLANPRFKKLLRIPPDGGFQKQVSLKLWMDDIKSNTAAIRKKLSIVAIRKESNITAIEKKSNIAGIRKSNIATTKKK